MIPDFLSPYAADIKAAARNFVKITATPLEQDEPSAAVTVSKFLGRPFWPASMPYPRDSHYRPMIMQAQINFSEIPSLPGMPREGMLQLFIASGEWYDGESRIVFHPDINKEPLSDYSFLTKDLYEQSPVFCEHRLAFETAVEYGDPTDIQFTTLFGGEQQYFDFQDSLTEPQQQEMDAFFNAGGHKIGGYSCFTQYDPREYNAANREDILLLQIDTDNAILWGDAGVAHVFINPAALQEKDFSGAYFHWDCC